MACTYYPLSAEGTDLPKGVAIDPIATAFCKGLATELGSASIATLAPTPGVPDQPIVIRGHVVRLDGGSGFLRSIIWFLGPVVVEVEGSIGDATTTYAELHAQSKSGVSLFKDRSTKGLLNSVAESAGRKIARQVIEALRLRGFAV
jgi:hypothetical protein